MRRYDSRMRAQRKPRESLSAAEARRVALAAQGFHEPRPGGPVSGREVVRTVRALGLVQIDSVNVLVRSHYLPLFSRLGIYEPTLLDGAGTGRRRRLFEYWGHEASLIPVEHQPLLRWRMRRARDGDGMWGGVTRFGREQRAFCAKVLQEITDRGPLGVSELQAEGRAPQRRLVGLESRQGGPRMAFLDRAGHHALASPVRARIRPDRTSAATRGARTADTGR